MLLFQLFKIINLACGKYVQDNYMDRGLITFCPCGKSGCNISKKIGRLCCQFLQVARSMKKNCKVSYTISTRIVFIVIYRKSSYNMIFQIKLDLKCVGVEAETWTKFQRMYTRVINRDGEFTVDGALTSSFDNITFRNLF